MLLYAVADCDRNWASRGGAHRLDERHVAELVFARVDATVLPAGIKIRSRAGGWLASPIIIV
jgi:hypothetical protein